MATANSTVKKTMSAKTSAVIYKVVCYALLVLFAIILIFPYVFMISKSLMTSEPCEIEHSEIFFGVVIRVFDGNRPAVIVDRGEVCDTVLLRS